MRVRIVIASLLCLTASGCFEGEMIYTVNPDASGKVRVVAIAPPVLGTQVAGDQHQEPDLDRVLQLSVEANLTTGGVTAWKDVSADFTADGRVRFAGTAYFKHIDGLTNVQFRLAGEKDGSLRLTFPVKSKGPATAVGLKEGERKEKPVDYSKLTDAELDREIFRQKVSLQTSKPLLAGLLVDLRLKSVFVLPGQVTDAAGFERGKDGSVEMVLRGEAVLNSLRETLAKDKAELRAAFRKANRPSALEDLVLLGLFRGPAFAVVERPGGPQFDYEREVREARAAYPALRKQLRLSSDVSLPGEKDGEKGPSGK